MASILIIDDDNQYLFMLESILKQHNHDVVVSNNSRNALIFLKEKFFDLIIIDIFMPEIDGFEFAQTLKDKTLNIPIIAISGGTHSTDSELMLSIIMTAYENVKATLTKPFIKEQLLQTVNDALKYAPDTAMPLLNF